MFTGRKHFWAELYYLAPLFSFVEVFEWPGKGREGAEGPTASREDINIDEHISFTLAFDEMFHGLNQLPRLRKSYPRPHTDNGNHSRILAWSGCHCPQTFLILQAFFGTPSNCPSHLSVTVSQVAAGFSLLFFPSTVFQGAVNPNGYHFSKHKAHSSGTLPCLKLQPDPRWPNGFSQLSDTVL